MLRLLIDTGNASPRTGTGVYGRGLIAALQRYSAAELNVEEAGISWTGNSFRPLRRLVYLWRLRQLAASGFRGADLVHFINIYVPRKRSRVAHIGTITDLDAIQHPELYTRRYALYYARTVQATLRRADMIFAISESVRGMILERYRIPEERITAAGIGLNPVFVSAVDATSPKPVSREPLILYVGRLEKKKNIAWLVQTVSRGVKNGALPKAVLVLAGGRGFGFDEINDAMREAGHTVQWVQDPEIQILAGLYLRASVVVLPSHCEGFGIPLLEAMYCQTPIVASKIPTSLEVAGDAARFFGLGNTDEFYAMMNDALKCGNSDREAVAAKERLRIYSWENLAPRYVSVYRQVQPNG